ncbi:MAG TPA: tripartite tricarboxylate transporter permease [Chloroflexota bacterium]
MEAVLHGMIQLFTPDVLVVIVLGSAMGLLFGAIPGLTATMAVALLVPFTFFMDPLPALVAMVTTSAMAIFAGDIPAALVRIPGTPASAAYTEESYRMTMKGQGELVLGVDVVSSSIGGLMGAVVLMVAATLLAEVAMQFTSFEYFWLAALGLSATVMVASGTPAKAGISILLGLLLSTVGLDVTLGYPRFTFGEVELLGGIDFIPAMIGLFGVAEVLRNVLSGNVKFSPVQVNPEGIFKGVRKVLWRYRGNVLRSGLLGTFIGILPGAGADIAAWLAYAVSRQRSKEKEKFGTGHIEPIVDAGTANNSCLAGDWVPALVFGIPGDSITAIVIGVLFMKGLRPGPQIFERAPELIYSVYFSFIMANILMIFFGYLAIKGSAYLLRVPRNVLLPAIVMFCIVGAYAINNSLFDVGVMLAMGVVGYILEVNGVPVAPVVLGLVLGPILEKNFMMSMIKSEWAIMEFFSRPIAATLGLLTLATWLVPVYPKLFRLLRGNDRANVEAASR